MPKVAVFFDWLNQWGGAEKVLLDILSLYPQAHLYTLVYEPSHCPWLPKNIPIRTSIINRLPFSRLNPICYTPFYDLALEQFDFSQYDIVISTTSVVGHCLLTPPSALFVCYFHNINRHLYVHRPNLILRTYQKIDYVYSRRPDLILCNSHTVAARLMNTYQLNSTVIHPGIDTHVFTPATDSHSDYYLTVSRLVPHKQVELTIQACLQLHRKLHIVGTGRQERELKNRYARYSNINFLGTVNQDRLIVEYQHCQALICPQLEDFGLTAIEVQACGRPVIAFQGGGYRETVIHHKTGYLFDSQNVLSLRNALEVFETLSFSPRVCRQQSLQFSSQAFMLNFKNTVSKQWEKHLKDIT